MAAAPIPRWIHLSILSGIFAATNSLFAKLTTTSSTTTLALTLSHLLHLSSPRTQTIFEYLLRAAFFGLNLAFNAVMWGLFTAALKAGTSATKVSVVNISANFVVTAVLGWGVFSEGLPPLWWVGAGLLVAGSVVISRKDQAGPEGGYEVVAGDESGDEVGLEEVGIGNASGSEPEEEAEGEVRVRG